MNSAVHSYYLQELRECRNIGRKDADKEIRGIFDNYVSANRKYLHIAYWNKMEAATCIKELCYFLNLIDCLDSSRKKYLSKLICAGMEFCLVNRCKVKWFSYFLDSVIKTYIGQEKDGSVAFCLFCLLDYCGEEMQKMYYSYIVKSDMSMCLIEYYLELLGGMNKGNKNSVLAVIDKLKKAGEKQKDFMPLITKYS